MLQSLQLRTLQQQSRPAQPNTSQPFSHVTLTGAVEPLAAAPGSVARLVIAAEPADGWHIYALADKDPKDVSKPTLIALTQTGGLRYRPATASAVPVEETTTVNQSGKVQYHNKPVSWTIELEVPKEAQPGKYPIAGIIGYQTCEATACDAPTAAKFSGEFGRQQYSRSRRQPRAIYRSTLRRSGQVGQRCDEIDHDGPRFRSIHRRSAIDRQQFSRHFLGRSARRNAHQRARDFRRKRYRQNTDRGIGVGVFSAA